MSFPPQALVLVCYVPSIKDLEIARMLGWYRIPLKSAPKVIDVDYLAFYQGGVFGEEHRWQIEYFAEYRGHELTTRAELLRDEKDHPRAREEYFKVQISQLQRLSQPVMAKSWKRLTFLYTTGQLMNRALMVNDLVVHDEEKSILWKALRERSRQPLYNPEDSEKVEMDPALIQLILGLNGSLPDVDLDDY